MKTWLIGPVEQETLDIGLQRSQFPFAVRFFTAQDRLQPLAAQAEAVLLLEPLRRLLPEDVWEIDKPLIGLCSRPSLPIQQARFLLQALDGVIPLETGLEPYLPPDLPVSSVTVWNLGPQHQPRPQDPVLFPHSYVLPQSWSPYLAQYEQNDLRPDYFIQVHPGRLPFYLQRSQVVLMDTRLSSEYFQALACGASLLVHAGMPNRAELEQYLTPDQDFCYFEPAQLPGELAALKQGQGLHPATETLESFRLAQTLPKALTELYKQLQHKRQRASSPWLAARQLAGIPHPQALIRLQESLPGLPAGPERLFIELCFFQQLRHSPYAQTDPNQIQASVTIRLNQLPAGPERDLIQMQAWMQAQQPDGFAQALDLLQQLQTRLPEFEQLNQPAQWQQDPLLLDLLKLYAGPLALRCWLGYQQILCLAHLQRYRQASELAETLLKQAYFPSLANLWQAVQEQPAQAATCQRWLAPHPQNLSLARNWLEALASEDLPAAQTACLAYQDLCRRYFTQSQEIEHFFALERRLQTGSEQAQAAREIYVLWEGPLHSHSSLASINQRWMQELLAQPELRISHIPYEPPELPAEPATAALEQNWLQAVDVFVSHRWPPRNTPPVEGKWASIIPWEFGVIPASWVQQLNAQLDRIWVPSAFVAQSFAISGVNPELLCVIPNGIDPEILTPEGPRMELPGSKSFRFLFVGGMLDRKGLDLLLEAYGQAFTRTDDVALVIKSFGSGSHYALHPFHRQLEALQQRPDGPEILFLEDDFSPEEMAALYRACDAYVHPYRGEGFGMPILEAMACGLPVVIPNAGPAPEFCPTAASWQVPTRIRFQSSRDVQGLGLATGHPYYTEVDIHELARTLQEVSQQRERCQEKGQLAAQAARNYSWEKIFSLLLQEIKALARRRVPQAQRASLRQQKLQALVTGQITATELLTSLPEDPLLLEALLTQLPSEQWREAWQTSLMAGLPIEEVLRLARSLPAFWRGFPLRLCWPAVTPLPLLRPLGNDKLAVLQDPVHVDFEVSLTPDTGIQWLIDRPLPAGLQLDQEIWYSDRAQLPELLAAGAQAEKLHYQPLGVDFSRYSPDTPAIVLEESLDRFVFLSIFDWERDGGWKELLSAYFSAFDEADPVNLVFKPLGQDFEAMVGELMDWMSAAGFDPEAVPALTFVQEDLSVERLPGLYRGADCFVATHAHSGIWHLAAQASGLPVISRGHFGFLERPFSEPFQDQEHLRWLLCQHQQNPERNRGQIVRDFLRPTHDLFSWQKRVEDRLIRKYFYS